MKITFPIALAVLVFFALAPVAAVAQGGCVDSPENPNVVLALVGGASAAVSILRTRFKR